jgi:methylenetetrahydrofolate reductase (NADPH)
MFDFPYLFEILTPKKSTPDVPKTMMNLFAERYARIMDSGSGFSVPDNPMGQPRFSALETLEHMDLPVEPEKMVMNLNTFHSKEELDERLKKASDMGVKYLLVVRGDGEPALSTMDPQSIGGSKNVATSIDLLRFINTAYRDVFVTGAAFNPYNPMPFEINRMKQKVAAGAKFVITQPVIGQDPNVEQLQALDVTIVIEAWMSTNIDLLYKSVRKENDEKAEGYNPAKNLQILHDVYPKSCIYLSMLSFKQAWKPLLPKLL